MMVDWGTTFSLDPAITAALNTGFEGLGETGRPEANRQFDQLNLEMFKEAIHPQYCALKMGMGTGVATGVAAGVAGLLAPEAVIGGSIYASVGIMFTGGYLGGLAGSPWLC
jgi:hypothetical protein